MFYILEDFLKMSILSFFPFTEIIRFLKSFTLVFIGHLPSGISSEDGRRTTGGWQGTEGPCLYGLILCSLTVYKSTITIDQGLADFSVKNHIVNSFGLMGCVFSATRFCYCNGKAVLDNV